MADEEKAIDLQEIIGHVVRRERQDRRLTIKELGDKAGLSEIYVGEIERGQKYPSSKVLEALAKALELDMAEFLELMAEEIRNERRPAAAPRPGSPARSRSCSRSFCYIKNREIISSLSDAIRSRFLFPLDLIHGEIYSVCPYVLFWKLFWMLIVPTGPYCA